MMQSEPAGLTPEKLQIFLAGLSGLGPDEVRKAKVLFIRNEISELRALLSTVEGFKSASGCLTFLPLFWPIQKSQAKMFNASIQLKKDLIANALYVWKDDLGEEGQRLQDQIEQL